MRRTWLGAFGAACVLAACGIDRTTAPLRPTVSAAKGAGDGDHTFVTVNPVPVPSGVWGIAIRADGLGLATDLGSSLVVFDTRAQTVLGTIGVGSCPTGVAFSPDGLTAYSANQCDNTVSIVDVAQRVTTGVVSVPGSPFSVLGAPDNVHAYVGTGNGTIAVVNGITRLIESTTTIGGAVNGMALDANGRWLYATTMGPNVVEFDPTRLVFRRTFAVGGLTQGVTLNASKTHLIVANESGFVHDIDLATGARLTLPLPGGPFGAATLSFLPKTVIVQTAVGSITAYDEKTFRLGQTLAVGGNPRRVAVDPGSRTVVVTNGSVLDFIK